MTNEELQKLKDLLLPELKTALLAEAQGVGDNDVRPVSSLKDIKSLLAYLKVGLDVEIVEAPLSLLQVEIQTTEANVQWRLGEGDWENIIAISDLQKPATDAAKRADEKMVQISEEVSQVIIAANAATGEANTAAGAANEAATNLEELKTAVTNASYLAEEKAGEAESQAAEAKLQAAEAKKQGEFAKVQGLNVPIHVPISEVDYEQLKEDSLIDDNVYYYIYEEN